MRIHQRSLINMRHRPVQQAKNEIFEIRKNLNASRVQGRIFKAEQEEYRIANDNLWLRSRLQ